jgi:spore coat polysaccharide biosynthesis protein SpsF
MNSSRLPGKVLREIAGKPLLSHVTGRLEDLRHAPTIVVATTVELADDFIEHWCRGYGIKCYRGSEVDVLDRYYACAKTYRFDHIVRLTADNPFTDIAELDRLIDLHLSGNFDYTHAFGTLPVGVGGEMFTFAALEKSHQEGLLPHHREHVNEYFLDRADLFRIAALDIPSEKAAPDLRLTVDTEQDWRLADKLANQVAGRWLTTEEAIASCSSFV